ncbi:hypothetical protein SAM23877_0638 [Streptomyces ambofaciens ATCC 23877]|uniref:Transposase n=1 Tax=Streptomyces ambofaciens (strain ATCC 23877 / 3486 / DSM 40053 / JCM 4204 / NBRC 12836 / NRRL B-2516) TaxID=278992 RepID=A0A0K2ALG4_STRA7|nr:hypothetical protein SAM23877_0638 [Streptomyces ambofaciens ATCC 23877]
MLARAGRFRLLTAPAASVPACEKRGIAHTIPEKTDQRRHRLRRGGHGGRPPRYERETYRRRNLIER